MQIFIIDSDPKIAAYSLCDKHVIKQILESAQMLCHAIHKFGAIKPPYKEFPKQYHNHPCTKWVIESIDNFKWLYEHAIEMCAEYTARYGKIHKSQSVIDWCIKNPPTLPKVGLTPFAIAIKKDLYSHLIVPNNPVQTYRNYYIADKARFARWKRNKPAWYTI